MGCKKETGNKGSDCVELEQGRHWFDASETAWLIGQAVRYLNGAEPTDERHYQHTVALLREHKDGTRAISQLAHATSEDPTLRWNLLHVLGDAGDVKSAKYLVTAALEPLPDRTREKGCEGPFDTELLNRTMAVIALATVAGRHKDAAQSLLKIIGSAPARPVLIEAVKAAVDLGLQDRVREMLPEEERWILDIKRVSYREVNADPEREDGKEVGYTPPRHRADHTAPSSNACCGCREN
ncbi:hypothetical protein [Agrilutibacter solisilvae]|uniref:Uncharacterized protein n=1 Tax=Agrilutibacter solisilvae TaxID=2763317 RepID=A0A974Y4K9_9GAMM|nr:hypothetical protein [Lysobacter solisilvae]QSX77881.1 hypothetical protein I8J32_014300 [Lysobacter solisilvae]